MTSAFSGRPLSAITLDAALAGELTADDMRIHPSSLNEQARIAEQHGNPQLAANLRRAAELTALADHELIEIYEVLRPNRSTREQIEATAVRLENADAPACAALVREALAAYVARGLVK